MKYNSAYYKRMIITFATGFSSGLPFALTGGTFKLWLSRKGVDASTIGYMSWVTMAYSLKFLWSPLLDRYGLFGMGRRRGWMLLTQVALIVLIAFMGTLNPDNYLWPMIITAVAISFFSATQDTAIDAFRRELLADGELGTGSALTIYGYRIAMWVSGGLGISMVGTLFDWRELYFMMAGLMSLGLITTLWVQEPTNESMKPKSLKAAVIEPFVDFMKRPMAIHLLFFILIYKMGDIVAGQMLPKFYVDMQFTNFQIGFITKTVGFVSSLLGLYLGGMAIQRWNLFSCMIMFGIMQSLSTVGFSLITLTGPESWALGMVIVGEDLCSGMSNSAVTAFLSQITNKKFTATQFALLTSISSWGRTAISGFGGLLVDKLGWTKFYYVCGTFSIPGVLLAYYIYKSTGTRFRLDSQEAIEPV